MLTNTAFNAMLKTLEEPPEYLKFVLATTDRRRCRSRCWSRCLQFNLRPMAPRRCVDTHPRAVPTKTCPPNPRRCVPALAHAGLHAQSLLVSRSGHCLWQRPVAEAGVRQMLGACGVVRHVPSLAALAQGDGRTVVGNGRCPAHERPVGRVDAGRNGRRAAAHGAAVYQAVPQMARERWTRERPRRRVETATAHSQMPQTLKPSCSAACATVAAPKLGLAPEQNYAALSHGAAAYAAFKAPAVRLKKLEARGLRRRPLRPQWLQRMRPAASLASGAPPAPALAPAPSAAAAPVAAAA